MFKKSKGKGKSAKSAGPGLIHPTFPPQGAPQPSYMGSQSDMPSPGMPGDPNPASMPGDPY